MKIGQLIAVTDLGNCFPLFDITVNKKLNRLTEKTKNKKNYMIVCSQYGYNISKFIDLRKPSKPCKRLRWSPVLLAWLAPLKYQSNRLWLLSFIGKMHNFLTSLSILSAYSVAVIFCWLSWVACWCLESPMLPVFRAMSLVTFTSWKASPLSHVNDGYRGGGGAGTWEVGKEQVESKL